MSQDKKKVAPTCATCPNEMPEMLCMYESGSSHKGCPTVSRKDLLARANKKYEDPEIQGFAHNASVQE